MVIGQIMLFAKEDDEYCSQNVIYDREYGHVQETETVSFPCHFQVVQPIFPESVYVECVAHGFALFFVEQSFNQLFVKVNCIEQSLDVDFAVLAGGIRANLDVPPWKLLAVKAVLLEFSAVVEE